MIREATCSSPKWTRTQYKESGYRSSQPIASASRPDSPSHVCDREKHEVLPRDGHGLLKNYLYEHYQHVKDQALEQRRQVGHGHSPLMVSMYYFWQNRLLHKFNRNMYKAFKQAAIEDDALASSRDGLESLFLFMRRSLCMEFRENLFHDFVTLVEGELDRESFGIEQLWLFLSERNAQCRRQSDQLIQHFLSLRPRIISALKELDLINESLIESLI